MSYVEAELAKSNAANKGLGHRATERCEKCGLKSKQSLAFGGAQNRIVSADGGLLWIDLLLFLVV